MSNISSSLVAVAVLAAAAAAVLEVAVEEVYFLALRLSPPRTTQSPLEGAALEMPTTLLEQQRKAPPVLPFRLAQLAAVVAVVRVTERLAALAVVVAVLVAAPLARQVKEMLVETLPMGAEAAVAVLEP